MDDLISRAAAIAEIEEYIEEYSELEPETGYHNLKWCAMEEAKDVLSMLPAVDAVPVVHGRWMVTDAYPHNVYCSECYKTFAQTHWAVWEDGSLPRNFCPRCGAKMDGERRDSE